MGSAADACAFSFGAAKSPKALRDAGLPVLTDPIRHPPGVVAVRAAPERVRPVLSGMSFPAGVTVTAVDRADVQVHPEYPGEAALAVRATGITVITLVACQTPFFARIVVPEPAHGLTGRLGGGQTTTPRPPGSEAERSGRRVGRVGDRTVRLWE